MTEHAFSRLARRQGGGLGDDAEGVGKLRAGEKGFLVDGGVDRGDHHRSSGHVMLRRYCACFVVIEPRQIVIGIARTRPAQSCGMPVMTFMS
jgi:hypothetical protein